LDLATALAELGVTEETLDAQTIGALDRDGYAVLPQVLSGEQLDAIRTRLAELLVAEGDQAGLEVHQEAGTNRLADLVNKGPMFRPCFTDPRVLASVGHVLGQFKLSSLNFREALPGQGLQALHADYGGPAPAEGFQVCNSVWLLDDFTAENGATRVVPGSHRADTVPRLAMPDPTAAHPDEVLLIAPAGTVVVFNSHLWHGGTVNHTDRPRRALHGYFARRERGQQTDQRKYLRPETRAGLSPAACFILDVE
jgi:ectoine hydroxylase-related dioxygenase (phytanoyl-CoA dioxygenase family)